MLNSHGNGWLAGCPAGWMNVYVFARIVNNFVTKTRIMPSTKRKRCDKTTKKKKNPKKTKKERKRKKEGKRGIK